MESDRARQKDGREGRRGDKRSREKSSSNCKKKHENMLA